MPTNSLKRKLLRARIALSHTIQNLMNLNRKRKVINSQPDLEQRSRALEEEIEVLNKLASNQAQLVQRYERELYIQNPPSVNGL